MSWIRYIWIMIIIYLVCSARTCNEDEEVIEKREEQATINQINNIKNAFTADSLSEEMLTAFEFSAAEKLNDLSDYLKIISDITLDMNFRQQAAKVVRNMFVTVKVDLSGLFYLFPRTDFNSLDGILKNSLNNGNNFWLKPVQIVVNKPFIRTSDTSYAGKILFNYEIINLKSQDKSEIPTGKLEIEICLVRELNSFGNDQLRVWEAKFGDIK